MTDKYDRMVEAHNDIYTGVFFDNGLHMTYHFDGKEHKPQFPEGVVEGETQIVSLYALGHEQQIGFYACFINIMADGSKLYDQYNSGNPLHITLYHFDKIPPSEAGVLLKSYRQTLSKGITPTGYSPLSQLFRWSGTWKTYRTPIKY